MKQLVWIRENSGFVLQKMIQQPDPVGRHANRAHRLPQSCPNDLLLSYYRKVITQGKPFADVRIANIAIMFSAKIYFSENCIFELLMVSWRNYFFDQLFHPKEAVFQF